MKITFNNGLLLTERQLQEVGALLFLTDPEIYPTAFKDAETMGIVFPSLTRIKNGMFSLENLLVALHETTVCGILVGCNGHRWPRGTLSNVFAENGLPCPPYAADAEEKYFVYEAEHENGDYVLCLCVSPEYRNNGIARNLLLRYLRGKNKVSLECLESNRSALELYRSLGFHTEKQYKGYSTPGTPLVPVVRMVYESNAG